MHSTCYVAALRSARIPVVKSQAKLTNLQAGRGLYRPLGAALRSYCSRELSHYRWIEPLVLPWQSHYHGETLWEQFL